MSKKRKEPLNNVDGVRLNPEQAQCSDVIRASLLTMVLGEPGSGKTFSILHTFVREYLKDHSKKIIIYRSPGEAGPDSIGFLPGDLCAKIQPHFEDNVEKLIELLGAGKFRADLGKRILFLVPNFSLGRTHNDSLILIDDAQVMTPTILKQLVTRTGQNSKCVVSGDPEQQVMENKSGSRVGLNSMVHAMTNNGIPYDNDVGYYEFSGDYNMRSEIVRVVSRRWR